MKYFSLLFLIFVGCWQISAQDVITLPEKSGVKPVDFFYSNSHLAILASVEETTLIGTKSTNYVYLNGEYLGPYEEVLDVHISPSGSKYAVVFKKLDNRNDFVSYDGVEYELIDAYSRYNEPIMGFLEESFFLSGTEEVGSEHWNTFRPVYFENKMVPGVDLTDLRNSDNHDVIFGENNEWVAFPNIFFRMYNITFLYPDGSTKRYYHGDENSENSFITLQASTTTGSPAETAGVIDGDILYTINDQRVWGLDRNAYYNTFQKYIGFLDELTFGIMRDGEIFSVTVPDSLGSSFLKRGEFTVPRGTTNKRTWAIDVKAGVALQYLDDLDTLRYGDQFIENVGLLYDFSFGFTPTTKTPYFIWKRDNSYVMFKSGEIHENVGREVLFSGDETQYVGFTEGMVRLGTQEAGPYEWVDFNNDFTSMAYYQSGKLYIDNEQVKFNGNGRFSEYRFTYDESFTGQTRAPDTYDTYLYHKGSSYFVELPYINHDQSTRSDYILSPKGEHMSWIVWNNGNNIIYQDGVVFDRFRKNKPTSIKYLSDDTLISFVKNGPDIWMGGVKYGPFISDDIWIDSDTSGEYAAVLVDGFQGSYSDRPKNPSNSLPKDFGGLIQIVPHVLHDGQMSIGRIFSDNDGEHIFYIQENNVIRVDR